MLALDTPVSIVPPPSGSSTGPLQIVSDSSGYYYNNPTELAVYVGNNPSDGTPITQQALGLSFYGQGLAAGSSLTFSLTFDKAIVNGNPPQIPQFTVVDPTTLQPISSIQIKYDGTTTTSQGGGSDSTTSPPISRRAGAGPEAAAKSPNPCRSWSGRHWPAPGSGGSAGSVISHWSLVTEDESERLATLSDDCSC